MTLVVESKDDLDRVVPRLSGAVRCDLVVGVDLKGAVLRIVIDDAHNSLRDEDNHVSEVRAGPTQAPSVYRESRHSCPPQNCQNKTKEEA